MKKEREKNGGNKNNKITKPQTHGFIIRADDGTVISYVNGEMKIFLKTKTNFLL